MIMQGDFALAEKLEITHFGTISYFLTIYVVYFIAMSVFVFLNITLFRFI